MRTVTIAFMDDNAVKLETTDDCYVCPYDTGDKFNEHTCGLTGEHLSYSGRHDIEVPETCPFPALAIGEAGSIESRIISRYQSISEKSLTEIMKLINGT